MARSRYRPSDTNGRHLSTRRRGLNPGDEAAPGTPGTGDDLCPACRGTGPFGL